MKLPFASYSFQVGCMKTCNFWKLHFRRVLRRVQPRVRLHGAVGAQQHITFGQNRLCWKRRAYFRRPTERSQIRKWGTYGDSGTTEIHFVAPKVHRKGVVRACVHVCNGLSLLIFRPLYAASLSSSRGHFWERTFCLWLAHTHVHTHTRRIVRVRAKPAK